MGKIMHRRLHQAAAAVVGAAVALMAAGAPAALAIQPPAPPPAANAMVSAVPSASTPGVDDGDVRAIAKVGSTMVIGGNFTSVGGQPRSRIAAFDTATGALAPFNLAFNAEVSTLVPGPTADTVYVGGEFTQVGTAAIKNVALVNLTTNSVVTTFVTPGFGTFGRVNDMVKVGNRLIVGGNFTMVAGKAHAGIAALNATTGAVDHAYVNVQFAGHHNDSGSGAQGPVGPWNLDVSPAGDRLAVIGNFKTADGLARDQVAQLTLGPTAATVTPDWNTNRYNPLCISSAFDSYVRGVSYSPDGSYFVIGATGGGFKDTLCDAAARFETYASGTDIQPTWVSESGGDTNWAVEITDNVVYVGGHQRWANNPYGKDFAGPGAVARPGLEALDPASGRPLQWNPGRNPPGKAVYALLATSEGLWVGSNTDYVGNFKYLRKKLILFPYAGGTPLAATNVGALPGTVLTGGPVGPAAATNVLYRVNAGGPAIASIDSGPDWAADSGSTNPLRNGGSSAVTYTTSGAAINPAVPASTPSLVFESERFDGAPSPEMLWTFPVAAGTPVQLRAYFANRCTCTNAVGKRVFNVDVNGTRWLTNYDIVADAGDQTGTMKSIDLTVPSTGKVTVSFGHVTQNPLVSAFEIVKTGTPPPAPAASDALSQTGLTSSAVSYAPEAAPDGGVTWSSTRAAFMVGNKVFYAATDGYLYSRTFTGTTWGPAVKINPYHDPAWASVSNNLGGTFDGALPSLYVQIPNLTGMFYAGGRLYYTMYGDSRLFWRWFSPDSGIVDERINTAASSVDLSSVRGIFAAGDGVYYALRTDSTLYRADWSGSAVTGTPVAVSGPAVDGVSWANRSMFLFAGPALNRSPRASFTSSCPAATCTFDASASADPDGTIASYDWSFGDGTTGTGVAPTHKYAASGTYDVQLTVKDDKGASGTLTTPVTVTVPANQAPTAAFTFTCTNATCAFDGSTSSDPDGTVATYAWSFGDSTSGAGATLSHAYPAAGDYAVTLTVTDDQGATSTVTKTVTVTAPASSIAFVGAAHSAAGAAKFKAATVPAGTQAGDLLLMVFSRPATSAFTGPTGVVGWTQVSTVTNGSVVSTVWQKAADAADLGATVRFDDPSGFRLGLLEVAAYRGANAGSVRAVSAVDAAKSSHTTPPIAVNAGDWVVSHWVGLTKTLSPWTVPADLVSRDSVADPAPAGTYRYEGLLADRGAAITTSGTVAGATASTTGASDREVMWSIAFGQ
ncbi:MAG TPA: PKD domain-containing protein [Intrasporangium sp.]|uniref:PKD domain-containing protein n=1 Tax=Intrasporangium sp. TaxID=1925024 RepID=UPI002D780142|nr:PKD domain-containing protein [Intrasporangium sp.]HET7399535.1 PKD domain-containing protein [Intrasporangium sp.]